MKKILYNKKILYFKYFCLLIIFIIFSYYLQKWLSNHFYDGNVFREYYASSPYADVKFRANDSVMYVSVTYKNLSGVSAIHIHTNNKGSPGPVLAWLGTTEEWQRGVAQTTAKANSPCCIKQNTNCSLAAPSKLNIPYLTNIKTNTQKSFVYFNNNGNSCDWIRNGTLLDVHGFNFQQKINGKLTSGKPGADIIYQSNFVII
jgi:hypothetical protein